MVIYIEREHNRKQIPIVIRTAAHYFTLLLRRKVLGTVLNQYHGTGMSCFYLPPVLECPSISEYKLIYNEEVTGKISF